MSDKLRKEIQHALDNISDVEFISLASLPCRWSRAQSNLRHNQHLVKVPHSPGAPMIAIRGTCVFTGVDWQTDAYSEDVLFPGLQRWAAGALAQDALRFMSKDEREFVMSGISPAGWDTMNQEEPGDREPFFPKPV